MITQICRHSVGDVWVIPNHADGGIAMVAQYRPNDPGLMVVIQVWTAICKMGGSAYRATVSLFHKLYPYGIKIYAVINLEGLASPPRFPGLVFCLMARLAIWLFTILASLRGMEGILGFGDPASTAEFCHV